MEWREQSSISCDEAYLEAQRWIEAVTKKKFGSSDFRSALENGVLLCELINNVKPGTIRRVNRLPTPIAGLDNLNIFLRACVKLRLKEAQLFHPGDLQDLSTRVTVKPEETNRRLKNVLITIYWLGRRAQCDPAYNGPYLNLKAFEGLLGTALYKALQESSSPQKDNSILRDSGFGDSWYSEQEYLHHFQNREVGHRRDDSLDSLDSLGSRPHSISSDIKGSSEGFCSDTEQDPTFRMADKDNLSYRRSTVLTPRTSTQFNQFLPSKDKASGYVPAPLRKKRAERNDDNRRSLTSPYTEEDIPLTRSKSTTDIDMEQSAARQMRYDEMQKYRERIKESDDKWQDDLSKWKNRRKSVNSDIVKKKEEREKIEEITYGSQRKSKTFKEMQEDRESRRQSLGSRLGSLSYLDDEDVFEKPASTPRATFNRSYTIDNPYSSSSSLSTFSTVTENEPRAASPATGRASSPTPSKDTVDTSVHTETTITSTVTPASYSSYQRSPSPADAQQSSLQTSSVETGKTTTANSSLKSELKVQEPKSPLLVPQTEVPSVDSQFKQPQQQIPMEPKPPVVSRVSASLPRSYQRSDSARLTSVVAPRPFPGSQATRISSLSRAYTTDDSHKPVNGDLDTSKKSSVPSRYHQFMTSEDEAQSSSAHSSEDEDDQEESTEKVITEKKSAAVQITSETTVIPAPVKDRSQESFCEMRISLNQKPNSSRDFGFQSAWDSTGARVTSIVPGSSAEMCQLQPGDEVVSVNGHQVAEMSYTSWKTHMEEALQEGSLVMDIRRHGKNSAPESKTFSSSLDFSSHHSSKTEPAKDTISRSVIDVASNGLNGSLRDEPVTMRNKDSEPISLKNLKRRSEFFEQGGSEPVMPDIPVPSITSSSSRWSWDPEEERRRQEKWQKEQERLLQEKYKRDQEKLQEEWLKAQQEITSTQQKPATLEVNNQSVGPHSPLSPVSQPLSSLWEEQERRRKEELEQRRQAEERELQRLREERERREQQEEEERRKREEEERMMKMQEEEKERQRRKEEEEKERRRREEEERRRRAQEAAEQLQRERERALEMQQQQCRMRSKSSPQLDDERPQQRVVGMVAQRGQQSQAELERQQLLKDMKKKAPLLTDSSWIRQRSATTSTGLSRESEGPPMRRGESLDNLDTNNYNSWRSSWTPRTNSHIPNYSRPQSALSGSTSSYGGWSGAPLRSSTLPSSSSLGSLRGGAATPSSNWSRQTPSPSLSSPSPTRSPEPLPDSQQRSRSVSGKKICTYCDTPLGKGAAMIIESLGLCYHLGCFKCFDCGSDLGGSEAGAEVRIRNKHLYCNTCYMRFKTGQPTAM